MRGNWRLALKFVLLFVALFVLQVALVAVIGGYRVWRYIETIIYPNLQQQAVYLISDIRFHIDDHQYLTDLTQRLHIDVAAQKGSSVFASNESMLGVLQQKPWMEGYKKRKELKHNFRPPPPRHREHFERMHKRDNGLVALPGRFIPIEWDDEPALLYHEHEFVVLLVFDSQFYPVKDQDLWLLGIGTLLLLVLAVMAVRWLLLPLRDLRLGIHNIEHGTFDKPIVCRRKDEFSMLAKAFNRMSGRIDEQLRQREQLLADISHELRSPMARMRLALEFLEQDKVKHLLLEELQDQERLLELILDNVRFGSSLGQFRLQMTRFDLAQLARQLVASYNQERISTSGSEHPLWVVADKTLLMRVFTNLLDNALRYSEGAVQLTLVKHPQHVYFAVSDLGPGIPPEEHERVFEAFYRLDKARSHAPASRGFGLGLSLCKRVVEAHKGAIGIDPEYQEGTRVWVTIDQDYSSSNEGEFS